MTKRMRLATVRKPLQDLWGPLRTAGLMAEPALEGPAEH